MQKKLTDVLYRIEVEIKKYMHKVSSTVPDMQQALNKCLELLFLTLLLLSGVNI